MFTSKFNRKEKTDQGVRFYVDFINGEDIRTEWCIPQTEKDFEIWIESRKEAMNTSKELSDKFVSNQEISFSKEEVNPISPEEGQKNSWFTKVNRLYRMKIYLVDLGIITDTDPEYLSLIEEIKLEKKDGYVEFI